MRDVLIIGPTPAEEDCAQVGDPAYYVKAIEECRRFIELIRATLGPEPEGAELIIKANRHDYGTYHEVAVKFDEDNQKAVEYAYRVENEAPTTWEP